LCRLFDHDKTLRALSKKLARITDKMVVSDQKPLIAFCQEPITGDGEIITCNLPVLKNYDKCDVHQNFDAYACLGYDRNQFYSGTLLEAKIRQKLEDRRGRGLKP
jgi:hypothetical protein